MSLSSAERTAILDGGLVFEDIARSIEGNDSVTDRLDEDPYYVKEDRTQIMQHFVKEVQDAVKGAADHDIQPKGNNLYIITFADYDAVLDEIDWEIQTMPDANRRALEVYGNEFTAFCST